MRILHVLRNNKHGGTQVLAQSFVIRESVKNDYYFLEEPVEGYLSEGVVLDNSLNLRDRISSGSYDLVICYTGLAILRQISKNDKTKVVIHLGSRVDWSLKYYLYSALLRIRTNVILVVPSEVVRLSLKPFFIRRAVLIPNPIRAPFFTNPVSESRSEAAAMVGRIDINDSARDWNTFCSLNQIFPDVDLNAVGDGSLRKELEKKYKSVKFHGNLNVHDLIRILDKSKYFIFLNNEIEGFGIALYEALARGCIVIAPNIPINSVIIRNDVNGILFDKGRLAITLDKVFNLTLDRVVCMSEEAKLSVKDFNEELFVERITSLVG